MLVVEIKGGTADRFIQWTTIENIFHKYRNPAVTSWHTNGQKYLEEYLVNGKLSRDPLEGPAVTVWDNNGQKAYEAYRVNGIQIRCKDFPC